MDETREGLLGEVAEATSVGELLLTEAKFAVVDQHQQS